MGIPVYLIFDTDSDCKPSDLNSNKKINTVLKKIMEETDLTKPLEMKIENNYASLNPSMTKVIKNAVGDALYTHIMDELKSNMDSRKIKIVGKIILL